MLAQANSSADVALMLLREAASHHDLTIINTFDHIGMPSPIIQSDGPSDKEVARDDQTSRRIKPCH
jgi:hypothetical protein